MCKSIAKWFAIAAIVGAPAMTLGEQPSIVFAPYVEYATGSKPYAVAIGDLNNDGLPDVVVATGWNSSSENDYHLLVFRQVRTGELVFDAKYPAGIGTSIAIRDFNNDGLNDVVTPTSDGIGILLQNESGKLDEMIVLADPSDNVRVAGGDFNNDGRLDVVAQSRNNSELRIFLQTADGFLTEPVTYDTRTSLDRSEDLEVGDVTNDGLDDIVVASGNQVAILAQLPEGGFPTFPEYLQFLGRTYGIAIADVSGDGRNDLAVVHLDDNFLSHIEVFVQFDSNGKPALKRRIGITKKYFVGGYTQALAMADLNGDGFTDMVGSQDISLPVFPGGAGAVFEARRSFSLPYQTHTYPHGLAIGDINNDGKPDVVLANTNQKFVVLRNASATPEPTPTPAPEPTPTPTPEPTPTPTPERDSPTTWGAKARVRSISAGYRIFFPIEDANGIRRVSFRAKGERNRTLWGNKKRYSVRFSSSPRALKVAVSDRLGNRSVKIYRFRGAAFRKVR